MKISKLFHWLYALVMFLPVFFWIPTAFYYGFNEHASASEHVVEITEPLTVNFNQLADTSKNNTSFVNNEVNGITLTFNSTTYEYKAYGTCNNRYDKGILNAISFTYGDLYYFKSSNTNLYLYGSGVFSRFSVNTIESPTASGNASVYLSYFTNDVVDTNFYIEIFNLTQMFGAGNEPTINEFNNMFPKEYYSYTSGKNITINVGTGNYVTYLDISNVMSYSWQDVWTLPMFSWTHDTFFSAPFNYIASLFGIQAGNTLSYCLSYWFSISIIWLVFDLMIYVPLLVHRWLDKAAIE